MNIKDFDRRFRFKMVKAYPYISGVRDVYEASHDEIDTGFARIMQATNLRRTLEMYVAERQAARNG